MYLADFDELETPNLNRVRATLADVGTPKSRVVAQQIWDINPYASLHQFSSGVNEQNIDDFLGGNQPVTVVFDEIDDFKTKLRLRHASKLKRIPVVMLTGLGDSVLIDIERYDLEPELAIFNGLIGGLESEIMNSTITANDARRFAAQIVGIGNVPTRAIESLLEMGKTLIGRPQLGSTVAVESAIASYVVRQLLLSDSLTSGRYRLDLATLFNLPSATAESDERGQALNRLMADRPGTK